MSDRDATLAVTIRRFWPQLRLMRGKLALGFALSLAATGLAVLTPIPVKLIIDAVLGGKAPEIALPDLPPASLVLLLAGCSAGLALLAALASAGERLINARVRERLTLALRLLCLVRIMSLTPLCRSDDRSGELGLRLVDDTQQLARLFTKTLPTIVRHMLMLAMTLGALTWIAPLLGAAALGIALALALMIRFAARPLRETAKAKRVQEGRVAGRAQEILRALSFIQASGAEGEIREGFEAINRDSLTAGVEETRAAVRLERAMQVANGLAVALVVGAGGWLALKGRVSAGDLAIAVVYLNQMLRPIEKINELASAVSGATSRAARLAELLGREEALDRTGTFSSERVAGRLMLASPQFAYDYGRRFEFDTIDIPAGTLVAVEGPSGSGKSTLLSLLARLFDPAAGEILLDGTPFKQWDLTSLRRQIAVCPQSPPLMAGSVREWMRLGGIDADDTALWAALDAVSLTGMLAERGGLDARLGEAGAGLSGGEQARLSLARALAAKRPVMLLDEPFANVDPVSARVMLKALAREHGQRTIIIVSHQPLPAELVDMQLRMAGGRLRVEGPATERASA